MTGKKSPVSLVEPLTQREADILAHLAEGKSNREIAQAETLTLSSVKWYVNQILGKLGATNRTEAVAYAHLLGLLTMQGETATAPTLPRNNLPRQLTSFIGREQVIPQVLKLVRSCALVTLTGAGGSGKTRLALQVGGKALMHFPDGVWLVELAPLADPQLVPQVAASALGLGEAAGRTPIQQLMDYLENRRLLLILDNCEHVVEAVAELAKMLLQHCPELHILASSREMLGVGGETTFRCPSLALPDPQHPPPLTELAGVEAVRLFVERAQGVSPAFTLAEDNAAAVAQICQRLDGIPLAIELAAARVEHLSPEQIVTRLGDRFRLLTGGSRTALPRHQTLRASIDWSYSLLSKKERLLLQRLSVFAGGWTLEAAEKVCAFGGLSGDGILDGLTSLVNKSLLTVDAQAKVEPRYRMLETVRQYAQEKLVDGKAAEQTRERHLGYFLALAERVEPELHGRTQIARLDQLEVELDNLRRALGWALQTDLEAELRLVAALMWFWYLHPRHREGVEWLEQGLAQAEGRDVRPEVRARALAAVGFLHHNALFSELDAADQRLQESLHIFQGMGAAGKAGAASALKWMSIGNENDGNYPRRIGFARQALELYQELEDPFGKAECLLLLSDNLYESDKDSEEARRLLKECLDIFLEIGDAEGIASAYYRLGNIALNDLEMEQARLWFEKSLETDRQVGNWDFISWLLFLSGYATALLGDLRRAVQYFHEAAALQDEVMSTPFYTFMAYLGLGEVGLILADHELARDGIHRALACAEKVHQPDWSGRAHAYLGELAWVEGDRQQALAMFAEAESLLHEFESEPSCFWLSLFRIRKGRLLAAAGEGTGAEIALMDGLSYLAEGGRWVDAASALDGLACLAARAQPERAARLFGASEHMNPYLVNLLTPPVRSHRQLAKEEIKATLGGERLAVLWKQGRRMSFDAAVALALKRTAGL